MVPRSVPNASNGLPSKTKLTMNDPSTDLYLIGSVIGMVLLCLVSGLLAVKLKVKKNRAVKAREEAVRAGEGTII